MLLAVTQSDAYLPIALLILMAIGFGVANVVLSQILGPRRDGKVKGETYESGMAPIGTARKRFNVRFYIIAMIFLIFDVEIIFLWPWAVTFPHLQPGSAESLLFLGRIFFFLFTTVVGLLYIYRKRVTAFE